MAGWSAHIARMRARSTSFTTSMHRILNPKPSKHARTHAETHTSLPPGRQLCSYLSTSQVCHTGARTCTPLERSSSRKSVQMPFWPNSDKAGRRKDKKTAREREEKKQEAR